MGKTGAIEVKISVVKNELIFNEWSEVCLNI